jgi:hypothetical protein
VRRVWVVLLASAVVFSGCERAPDDEMIPRPTVSQTVVTGSAAARLPRLAPGASTYVHGQHATVSPGEIHLGAKRIDVSPLRADAAVATLGGTYFLNAGEVWFTTGPAARPTGFEHVTRISVSADGRYLGFVDRNHGPARVGGVPLAAAIVYDTTTGRAVVRSYAGMGKVSVNLAATYAATPPVALGFGPAAFRARTPNGRYRYPLDGSAPSVLG